MSEFYDTAQDYPFAGSECTAWAVSPSSTYNRQDLARDHSSARAFFFLSGSLRHA